MAGSRLYDTSLYRAEKLSPPDFVLHLVVSMFCFMFCEGTRAISPTHVCRVLSDVLSHSTVCLMFGFHTRFMLTTSPAMSGRLSLPSGAGCHLVTASYW